jgi:hypothetical protein
MGDPSGGRNWRWSYPGTSKMDVAVEVCQAKDVSLLTALGYEAKGCDPSYWAQSVRLRDVNLLTGLRV